MKRIGMYTILAILVMSISLSCKNQSEKLFVGGFTKKGAKGLSVFEFNTGNGNLKLLSQADVGPSPSYFCFSKKEGLFYALNEVMEFNGTFGGGLTTLKYDDATGVFEKKSELLIPYGGPCHISVSPDSGYLFVANYPNGSVAVIKLNQEGIPETITDTILYSKSAPDESHAHMIKSNPSDKKIFVTDLGLDKILMYDFDTNTGKLALCENGTMSLPKGSGPRHFVFNADGSKLYVINELGSKMMVFSVDETKGLTLLQSLSTFREGYEGNNYCAEIAISNNGKYLYGSNRGENTIVTYNIGSDGLLTLAGHTTCGGDWPRNFVLDPSGKFLLVGNQKSDQISVFRIDSKSGLPVEPAKQFSSVTPAFLEFYR